MIYPRMDNRAGRYSRVGNQVKRAGTLGGEWTLLKNVKGEKMGRRVPMLLAAMAVMVALFAAAAYAAQIEGTESDENQCDQFATPARAAVIEGTERDEVLNESNLNDKLAGKDGYDTLCANLYGPDGVVDESPNPRGDRDRLSGGRQPDVLDATDGDARDVVDGGKGFDRCFGDEFTGTPTDPDTEQDKFPNCEVVNGIPVEE
jgi:hypothetical protein